MIDIIVEKGGKGFQRSAEGIAAHTRLGLERAWWLSAKDIQGTFDKQVLDRKSKTGRIYFRRIKGGRKRRHQASAPGQSPANRTGFYRKSFDFTVRGAQELAVGVTAPYGEWLETGTKRMRARPGLKNAVNASERDIIRNLATEIENFI